MCEPSSDLDSVGSVRVCPAARPLPASLTQAHSTRPAPAHALHFIAHALLRTNVPQ